jgi:hypothetical protein
MFFEYSKYYRALNVMPSALTAASMKVTIFWDVSPRNLAEFTDISEALTATHGPDHGASKLL